MSDLIYPIGLIGGNLSTATANRVLKDEFESGSETRRAVWSDKLFRRKFTIEHSGLTRQEIDVLADFYRERNGELDSFLFRNSVERSGNHRVRFDGHLSLKFSSFQRDVGVVLLETAPRRSLPSLAEITDAAGIPPGLWFDAQREAVMTHLGSSVFERTPWDAAARENAGAWYGTGNRFAGLTQAYSHYSLGAQNYALGPTPLGYAGFSSGAIFLIARAPASGSYQVPFAIGQNAAGKGIGLSLHADNRWEPWTGSNAQLAPCHLLNSAANTWRSFLIYWSSTSAVAMYVNGSLVGSATLSALDTSTPTGWSLGATPAGTASAAVDIGTAIWLPGGLASPGMAASRLHGLFAYQFGL